MIKIFAQGLALSLIALGALALNVASPAVADTLAPTLPPTPPQDQGLPYTRTAQSMALARITSTIAVMPGSRYAYVYGHKVRFDNLLWHEEAIMWAGKTLVPRAFAAVIAQSTPEFDTPPSYLADRWVYTVTNPSNSKSITPTVTVDGIDYVDLAAAASAARLQITQEPSGLVLIGTSLPDLSVLSAPLMDSVTTLFDTPEKFQDPTIATKYIPSLELQGAWTDHVKVTPEQLAIVNGPETKWATTPVSDYDYHGINMSLFGSKVPPPGVYPRVLFSPEDVPAISKRVFGSKIGQMAKIEMEYLFNKSWWDPTTDDGKLIAKLASGDTAGLNFDMVADAPYWNAATTITGEKQGIFNTHIAYIPECLEDIAFYCLLTGDDVHGRQAAAAIVNYYKMREPFFDGVNATSDTEFGGTYTQPDGTEVTVGGNGGRTSWRTISGIGSHMNLGLSLDFAGKWMTEDEKQTMYRVIAKATYGKRSYAQDGPVRFRDVNWMAWDLPDFIAVTSIEGQPGFDKEAYDQGRDSVKAYLDWGIDDHGVIYESNGKTPGALQFATLSMVTIARRGFNCFGHPHLRKLMMGQAQMTSPTGMVVMNSGTHYTAGSKEHMSLQFVDELRSFYPQEHATDYLLSVAPQGEQASGSPHGWNIQGLDLNEYQQDVSKVVRLRLPSPTYPGFVKGVLFDSDWKPTTREDLKLPLDFDAPVHGVFSSFSDNTPNATWMGMMVRPDHYLGAGHHHADAGQIYFAADGIDWFTQTRFDQTYDGKYFSLVQVDGHSEAEAVPQLINGYNAPGKYLGASISPTGSFARADLTYAYSYRWLTQPPAVWPDFAKSMGWEMDPTPQIEDMFAGTARYKMRPWWATYTTSNYIATSRAPFNPMQYVFRATGLVRGTHPYGVVVDDLKKDDQTHLYQWAAMFNDGVWKAQVDGLQPNQAALGYRPMDDDKPRAVVQRDAIVPQTGEPLLLVCSLGSDTETPSMPLISVETAPGILDKNNNVLAYDRLMVNHSGTDAHFKVLLIPFHAGDALPIVSYDAGSDTATVKWADQVDSLTFTSSVDGHVGLTVSRGGQTVASD